MLLSHTSILLYPFLGLIKLARKESGPSCEKASCAYVLKSALRMAGFLICQSCPKGGGPRFLVIVGQHEYDSSSLVVNYGDYVYIYIYIIDVYIYIYICFHVVTCTVAMCGDGPSTCTLASV